LFMMLACGYCTATRDGGRIGWNVLMVIGAALGIAPPVTCSPMIAAWAFP